MAKNIQIRDVPADLHRRLRARAAEEGMSLSDYLLGELKSLADRPSLKEVAQRAGARGPGIPIDEIVRVVREMRGPIPPE